MQKLILWGPLSIESNNPEGGQRPPLTNSIKVDDFKDDFFQEFSSLSLSLYGRSDWIGHQRRIEWKLETETEHIDVNDVNDVNDVDVIE